MQAYQKWQWQRIRVALMLSSKKRNDYIKKHHIFYEIGDNFFFQPRILPADPKLIKFHNNVIITSNVTFVNHDVFHTGLNNLGQGNFSYNQGCIEIMDNVFIGCNTTILGNVRIGPNVVIAAGSVITKDIPPNSVVAGVPAKKIGTFTDYVKKRKEVQDLPIDELWQKFSQEKNKS